MPDPIYSDEALLEATGRGDLKAFEEIVRRHQEWAWKIAHRFTGREEEAAEVTQNAFLRLLDASARYTPAAKFRTYFYQIIARLCFDRAKKKQPLFLDKIPDSPDPQPGAADAMMQRETATAVRAALDSLSAKQRMAIVLRYFEGLNYAESASILEVTPKAVERLLARGREHLKAVLGEGDDFSSL